MQDIHWFCEQMMQEEDEVTRKGALEVLEQLDRDRPVPNPNNDTKKDFRFQGPGGSNRRPGKTPSPLSRRSDLEVGLESGLGVLESP